MKKMSILRILAALFAFLPAVSATASAAMAPPGLLPDTQYTITLQKLTSAGALETLETVTGTTDADGVLSFTLSNVPSKDTANFIFVTVTDGSGVVVRKGVSPAPPPNDNNATGLNILSTKQADALVRAAQIVGSDDPIVAAYLFIILRSPEITDADIENIAQMGVDALTNPDLGFQNYLLTHGVSESQLDDLKKCLVYNPDNSAKTLRDFARYFFNAVEASDDDAASQEMQKAGGFMADVFLDAGICAGIDAGKILAAHDIAGDGANAGGHMAALPLSVQMGIETSMSTFNRRISIVRITAEYANALNVLGASGAQVTRFLDSVTAMAANQAAIDRDYAGYYMNREAYLAAHPGATDNSVRAAMDSAYSAAWTQFQSDIEATDGEKAAMIAGLSAANPGLVLPPDFGTWVDQNGTVRNWPVTQVVLVNWLADSSFRYAPRDNTAIPAAMAAWMGSCSNASYWDQMSCQGNGGTWPAGRRTYDTGSEVFSAYLALQEDLNILQMSRFEDESENVLQTGASRAEIQGAFNAAVQAAADRISGSKGGAAISAEQKRAIVKLLVPPQM